MDKQMHAPRSCCAGRALRWLAIALVVNGLIYALLTAGLMAAGESATEALKATSPGLSRTWLHTSRNFDSWLPMTKAYIRHSDHPEKGIYSIFFEDKVKFQYPPTSLLILKLFPRSMLEMAGEKEAAFRKVVGLASNIAGFITIFLSILILEIGLRRYPSIQPFAPAMLSVRVGIALVLGLTFYPLVGSHYLGQVQVYLNMLVAGAVFFHLLKRDVPAGICVGLCCLVKPQLGLVLLWGVVRRKWSFTLAMGSIILVGFACSLVVFGWNNHIEYIAVLRNIAQLGEVYWPNQSVNGLLNRFLLNGDPITWSFSDFSTFNRTVYLSTTISSLVMLAAALLPSSRGEQNNDYHQLDFLIIVLAATMASPVAWGHHYGILFPLCSAVLPVLFYAPPFGRWTAPLFAISYAAISNVLLRPNLIFTNRWLGLLGSHLFFGSVFIFLLLLAARSQALGKTRKDQIFATSN
jgi:hypothetical protein